MTQLIVGVDVSQATLNLALRMPDGTLEDMGVWPNDLAQSVATLEQALRTLDAAQHQHLQHHPYLQ